MKKFIGLAAVCAILVATCHVFIEPTQVDGPAAHEPVALAPNASLPYGAIEGTAGGGRPPAPAAAQTEGTGQGETFDRELRSLWSMNGAQLKQVFQRGLASSALEDKHLAYLAYDLFYSTFRSAQHADIPGVTGDVVRHMNEARRTLRETGSSGLACSNCIFGARRCVQRSLSLVDDQGP